MFRLRRKPVRLDVVLDRRPLLPLPPRPGHVVLRKVVARRKSKNVRA